MKTKLHSQAAGFTMLELLVSGVVAMAVGVAVFSFLNAGTFLMAKNVSLNLTSQQLRNTMDRVETTILQGTTAPTLITATGATTTTGPAAGVKFDRFIGGPYVIDTGSLTAGLVSSATSLTLVRSTDPLANPPIPKPGDVLRIDAAAKTLRPKVQTATPGASGSRQNITIALTTTLGADIPKINSMPITTNVVRNAAFIVIASGGRNQLRYYDNFESTTNLNDTTKYTVISDQLGVQAADGTPFSIVSISGRDFVSFSLKMRAGNFDRRLLGKQIDEFNTFSRVDASVRPRTAF